MIPAFGEILPLWDAKVGAGPSLSGTHYGQQRPHCVNMEMWSAAVGKSAYGRHTYLAGVNMLHEAGFAATIEQVYIKLVWETAPSSTPRASAPLRLQKVVR